MTLKLTLKKKWFDMIVAGVKTEEYREIKPHWMQRLMRCYSKGFHPCKYQMCGFNDTVCPFILKPFTKVEFTNGYGNHKPRITMECKGIDVGLGNPDWGADKREYYFVIRLGKEISRENFPKKTEGENVWGFIYRTMDEMNEVNKDYDEAIDEYFEICDGETFYSKSDDFIEACKEFDEFIKDIDVWDIDHEASFNYGDEYRNIEGYIDYDRF